MESRWFNLAIVLVWLSTTTWLVVAKVIPPLRRGQPPSYRSMYHEDVANEPPVAWEMSLNGKPLGWAVSRLTQTSLRSPETATVEVRSRIHFDRIPLAELSPAWMRVLLQTTAQPVDNLQMDALSTLEIDPLGHLAGFQSSMRAGGLDDGISITGRVQASLLKIEVKSGQLTYPFETYLPPDALVADELSPQSRLMGLHLGQEWTVPVFSPLRPPGNPVDVLQALVESHGLMMWEGEAVPVFEVVYKLDSGAALSSTGQPRARLWVRDDGAVLKQEVSVLGSRLVFARMSEQQSIERAKLSWEGEQLQRYPRRFRFRQNHPDSSTSTPSTSTVTPPSALEASGSAASSAEQSTEAARVISVAPHADRSGGDAK